MRWKKHNIVFAIVLELLIMAHWTKRKIGW